MRRKIYTVPETELIGVAHGTCLLAGSEGRLVTGDGGPTGPVIDNGGGDDDSGGTLSKRNNLWSGWE